MKTLLFNLIAFVPLFRRWYLQTFRWSLNADESEIVFNKPIPKGWGVTVCYSRSVRGGKTTAMTVTLLGESVQRA